MELNNSTTQSQSQSMKTVIQSIASHCIAASNCIASKNTKWEAEHVSRADQLAHDFLPSGSGVDCGTKIDWDATLRHGGRKIVFLLAYHHMNDCGMYDGWTEHRATVFPDWDGVDVSLSGRNRNGIKDYLCDILQSDFAQRVAYDAEQGRYVSVNTYTQTTLAK